MTVLLLIRNYIIIIRQMCAVCNKKILVRFSKLPLFATRQD